MNVLNVKVQEPTEGHPLYQVSADIAHEGKLYHVSGVKWVLPQMQNVHETMVFERNSDGTIDWFGVYTERYTTDILAVFHRFTQQ